MLPPPCPPAWLRAPAQGFQHTHLEWHYPFRDRLPHVREPGVSSAAPLSRQAPVTHLGQPQSPHLPLDQALSSSALECKTLSPGYTQALLTLHKSFLGPSLPLEGLCKCGSFPNQQKARPQPPGSPYPDTHVHVSMQKPDCRPHSSTPTHVD